MKVPVAERIAAGPVAPIEAVYVGVVWNPEAVRLEGPADTPTEAV